MFDIGPDRQSRRDRLPRSMRTCRGWASARSRCTPTPTPTRRHVREADDAVRIGPRRRARSYLDVDAIVAAAQAIRRERRSSRLRLSLREARVWSSAATQHGIAWIGPRADAIERMGSKIESKRIAERAGVPCVPGYHGDDQDAEAPARRGARHRLRRLDQGVAPAAAARGMRRVDRPGDFVERARAREAGGRGARSATTAVLHRKADPPAAPSRGAARRRPRTATSSICSSASARSSATTRRCSRRRRRRNSRPRSAASCSTRRCKLGRAIGYDSVGTVEFVWIEGDDDAVLPGDEHAPAGRASR